MSVETPEELARRGWAMMELDRPKEAIPLFQRAVLKDPEDVYSLCSLSAAYYALEDYPASLEHANRALAEDSRYGWAHARRAYSLRKLGDLNGALQSIQEALKLDPDNLNYRIELASVMADRRCHDDALQIAQQIVADFPEESSAHAALARMLECQRRWQEAAESNRRALALDPTNTQALTNLGLDLSELGMTFDAMMLTHQALRHDPSDEVAHSNLKVYASNAGFKSIDEFLATRSDPAVRERVARRTQIKRDADRCIERGDWNQALQILNYGLPLGPHDLDLLDRLSYVCIELQLYDTALNHASAAIGAAPYAWKGHWRRGQALRDLSETVEPEVGATMRQAALESAREAVRLSEDNSTPLYLLGMLLQKVGRDQEAEQACRQLLAQQPDWDLAYHAMGDLYLARKQYVQAEQWYLKGKDLEDGGAGLLHAAAIAVWEQGRTKDAERYLHQAIRMDPDEDAYHDMLRRIRNPLASLARVALKVFKVD